MTVARPVVPSTALGPEIARVGEGHPFRQEFRTWLSAHAPAEPEPMDLDEKFRLRRVWQRKLFDGGWAGPAWPQEFGGRGAGPLHQYMYYEELALARAPEPANAAGMILLGPTLMAHGTDALKRRFLPTILSGDEAYSQGFSEPNAGSDLAALRTRAELVGDEWVIHGQKAWTTWAQYSDYCFILARTEPESRRHRGLSLIICPVHQPGVEVRPIEQINGDPEFAEVFMDGARAPVEFTVGDRGDGWRAAMTMFQFERSDPGFTDHARLLVRLYDVAEALRGAVRARLLSEESVRDARDRVAGLWIRCQQLRRFNLRGVLHREGGREVGAFGSVVNLFWGDVEKDVASLAADVRGAHGLLLGAECSHRLLASRGASIYSGTSEIQRNIIAERILGLPR